MRKSPGLLAAAVIMLGLSASRSWAGDVCVVDNYGGLWKFKQVKSLTHPGNVSALTGFREDGFGGTAPVTGTAVNTSGFVTIGAFVHSMDPGSGSGTISFTVAMLGDSRLDASGNYDNSGDYVPDGGISFANVSCAFVPAPKGSGSPDPSRR